ncbi:hypothetical protein IAT40_005998 [Kwoniella sp. CBS 6097]
MPPVTSTSASTSTSTPTSATFGIAPPSLSHFVIFNPTIKLAKPERNSPTGGEGLTSTEQNGIASGNGDTTKASESESQDKDEQDDLREAAQILFYTSREAGGVSRDKMLRQVGLAKGLMGFADMLVKDGKTPRYWSIHGHRSRLLLFTPEQDFFFYVNITLGHKEDEQKTPVATSQGISDEMLVDVLIRGYEEFRLLHGPLHTHLPVTPTLSSLLDKYFTRFAFQFESEYLSTQPSLTSWIDGHPAPSLSEEIVSPLVGEIPDGSTILIVGPEGPLYLPSLPEAEEEADTQLLRYLHKLAQASVPPPHVPPSVSTATISKPSTDGRQMLGLNFGLADLGIGSSRRPNTHAHVHAQVAGRDGGRKPSWLTLGGWVSDIRRSSTPASASPSNACQTQEVTTAAEATTSSIAKGKEKESSGSGSGSSSKWGFGLGGLGDAFGGVGTALGLAGPSKSSASQPDSAIGSTRAGDKAFAERVVNTESRSRNATREIIESPTETSSIQRSQSQTPESATIPANPSFPEETVHLEEDKISIAELNEAAELDEELEWDRKWIWVRSRTRTRVESELEAGEGNGERGHTGYVKRRLRWIIRDNILIAILLPHRIEARISSPAGRQSPADEQILPSTKITLDLFSRIRRSINPPPPSSVPPSAHSVSTPILPGSASTHAHAQVHGDSYIATTGEGVSMNEGDIDLASDAVLMDLRGTLQSDWTVEEIYTKTPASKLVVAKRIAPDGVEKQTEHEKTKELYMVVGRKDASLTDADHAFRSFTRVHPEFGS